MSSFWAFSWVLIPIAGILAGAFKEWLQFKEKQNQLGTSTEKLEKKVEALVAALEKSENQKGILIERVQNLETIVTSQEWDLLEGSKLENHLESTTQKNPVISLPSDDDTFKTEADHAADQAARIARRLSS